jgi:hypothetical protein
MNISPSSSGSKSKPIEKPAKVRYKLLLGFLFDHEDISPKRLVSQNYMALQHTIPYIPRRGNLTFLSLI